MDISNIRRLKKLPTPLTEIATLETLRIHTTPIDKKSCENNSVLGSRCSSASRTELVQCFADMDFPATQCHRRVMSYISSGKLRTDIERVTGKTLQEDADAHEPEDDEGDAFTRFSGELRIELEALRALAFGFSPPSLCVLQWGDFCSVPELTEEEHDEVLEDWFDGDEAATDFVMAAVDIVNGGGGFYFVVHPDGRMGLVCEDPHSFDPLDCTVPQFLEALVAAHEAACNQGLDAATAELTKVVDEDTANLMLTFANRLTPEARGA